MYPAKNLIIVSLLTVIALFLTSIFLYLYNHTSHTVYSETVIPEDPIDEIITEKQKNLDGVVIDYEIPILMYHYVEYNENEEDFIRDSLNIEPDVFEQQLITLINADYEFLFPSEVSELINNNKTTKGQKYIVISFDDGFRDYYTDAFPILKKHNVKSVVYIVPNFLNKENYMYDSEVREIVKSGLVEIGSHTMNHLDLTSTNENSLNYEINESKRYIRDRFLYDPKSFAYPYGKFNNKVISYVNEAGYSNAVITEYGYIYNKNTLYQIPRIRPGYTTGDALLNRIE